MFHIVNIKVFIFQHLSWHIPIKDNPTKQSINDELFVKLYNDVLGLIENESYLHICYPLPHHPKPGNY